MVRRKQIIGDLASLNTGILCIWQPHCGTCTAWRKSRRPQSENHSGPTTRPATRQLWPAKPKRMTSAGPGSLRRMVRISAHGLALCSRAARSFQGTRVTDPGGRQITILLPATLPLAGPDPRDKSEHPTPNTEHRTSNRADAQANLFGRGASNGPCRVAFGVRCWVFDVRCSQRFWRMRFEQ